VSASAIGWYGPDTSLSKQNGFTEDAKADTAFLGETCRLWEESIEPAEQLGKRLVKLRTGIVLSNDGGALAEFKKPLKALWQPLFSAMGNRWLAGYMWMIFAVCIYQQ
jgi:NAD dependent epimerase/dehydratase family enzyme